MAQRNYPFAANAGVSTPGTGLSGASTGVKLSYVVPAGKNAMFRFAAVSNISGTPPTIALQTITGGSTVTLQSQTTAFNISPNIALNAADTVQVNVTTLGAGSAFDAIISVEEFNIG
jgi:hypothetical protein